MTVAQFPRMQPVAGTNKSIPPDSRDLFFQCHQCGTALVVDAAAAGMTVQCQRCGKPTAVPRPKVESAGATHSGEPARLAELERHLKENESQRTEVHGHINQLNIQLHRWQLRLQSLEKRNRELTTEVDALRPRDGSG
jgi:DNA-directed RNA polymerase subunit M/transcription elongation factor TFIIS